jgi:hypothetical protein
MSPVAGSLSDGRDTSHGRDGSVSSSAWAVRGDGPVLVARSTSGAERRGSDWAWVAGSRVAAWLNSWMRSSSGGIRLRGT